MLQEYLRKMADAGTECVVMEVSSQGLKLSRVEGITFDIGVFTNLEPDHIAPGEHPDFADYLYCTHALSLEQDGGHHQPRWWKSDD